jgi:uncharacterized membrane protein YeaQ/YmgE (transglycosylase-associated protein family)
LRDISYRSAQSCHHGAITFQEYGISNAYIWCAAGAFVGWCAGVLMSSGGRIVLIENVLVGVFGAFIGGEFVVAMLTQGPVDDKVFRIGSLAIALATAAVLLFLLKLMRGAVGPLQARKSKVRDRH